MEEKEKFFTLQFLKKNLLFLLGAISLLLGSIGIFLPVMPTVPFFLLSSACFSCASPKVHALLMKNHYFATYVNNYRHQTGIPAHVKKRSIGLLWASLLLSMVLASHTIATIVLLLVGIGVTWHLLSLKTC